MMPAIARTQRGTPIEAWPPRKFSGRPGYSARHFRSLAGAENDPLRVAARIVARRISDELQAESERRLADGDDFGSVIDWKTRKFGAANEAAWLRLCASFDEVIAALESDPKPEQLKAQIREAKAAKRKAGL